VSSREAKKFFDVKCSLRVSSKESGNESPDSRPAGSYAITKKKQRLLKFKNKGKSNNKSRAKKPETRYKTRGSITISRNRFNAGTPSLCLQMLMPACNILVGVIGEILLFS
jgi:hypothetical protein